MFDFIFTSGELDSAFGTNGAALKRIQPVGIAGTENAANAVVVQNDGKIVEAGTIFKSNHGMYLMVARYHKDGKLDKNFGKKGIDTISLNKTGFIQAMALQTDGKILVAGFLTDSTGDYGSLVYRFNTDGSIDSTFNKTGYVFTNFKDHFVSIESVAVQPDGKIILGGTYAKAFYPANVFLTIRYTADGSLDTTFNHTGIVNPITEHQTSLEGMKLLKNGKIVLCGAQDPSNFYTNSYALTKLNADGSTDSSFGINGYVYGVDNPGGPGESTFFTNLDEDNEDRLVVYGTYKSNSGSAIFRFNENGSFDSTFGNNGVSYVEFDSADFTSPWSVKVQSDGKILAGGYNEYTNAGVEANKFDVIRFNSNGILDSSFGPNHNGKVENSCNSYSSNAYSMCLAPDHIYLAGEADSGFAVAAYLNNDITLPLSFIVFSAQKQNNTTLLQWQTANEINNNYFSIERSADSKTFAAIGTQQALAGNNANNYSFVDSKPLKGINYYRLKQVDKDGKFTYSKIVSVVFTNNGVFAIAPNPANNFITVAIPSSNAASDIFIYTVDGKKILHQAVAANSTATQINIAALTAGVYNVVLMQDGKKEVMKMMKK